MANFSFEKTKGKKTRERERRFERRTNAEEVVENKKSCAFSLHTFMSIADRKFLPSPFLLFPTRM